MVGDPEAMLKQKSRRRTGGGTRRIEKASGGVNGCEDRASIANYRTAPPP
jgi:hypothetical protein